VWQLVIQFVVIVAAVIVLGLEGIVSVVSSFHCHLKGCQTILVRQAGKIILTDSSFACCLAPMKPLLMLLYVTVFLHFLRIWLELELQVGFFASKCPCRTIRPTNGSHQVHD